MNIYFAMEAFKKKGRQNTDYKTSRNDKFLPDHHSKAFENDGNDDDNGNDGGDAGEDLEQYLIYQFG